MGWQSKHWDTMEQIFWSLKYVGLEVIPEKRLVRDDKTVNVPMEMLGTRGKIYRRVRTAAEQRDYLLAQEEALNHVFDIAYGIAPDSLIEKSLLNPLGFADEGEFHSIGREVDERFLDYGVGRFQQQDGFFVSQNSGVGVELKLGSKSSIDQILKYAMLLALEEMRNGSKQQIGLLFIMPDVGDDHWKACGLAGPVISSDYYPMFEKAKSKVVREFYEKHEVEMRSVLDRMVLGAVSWSDFHQSMSVFKNSLGTETAGDQCLSRLIDGVLGQISDHKLTGLHT